MSLSNLTNTASIRSVLGVSELELRDDVLLNPIYTVRLTEKLYELNADLLTYFETATAAAPPSTAQTRFIYLVQTYAAYQIASQCLGALDMFAPITIKDSKSELTRAADPYKAVRADVPEALALMQRLMLKAYAVLNPAAPAPVLVTRIMATTAPLGTDPVTG